MWPPAVLSRHCVHRALTPLAFVHARPTDCAHAGLDDSMSLGMYKCEDCSHFLMVCDIDVGHGEQGCEMLAVMSTCAHCGAVTLLGARACATAACTVAIPGFKHALHAGVSSCHCAEAWLWVLPSAVCLWPKDAQGKQL